jgi:hypothetical protein
MITYFITHSLSDNQTILELLDYFWGTPNESLAHDHPNTGYTLIYQYNKGIVTLNSFFLLV